jgi:HEAT repeat protein
LAQEELAKRGKDAEVKKVWGEAVKQALEAAQKQVPQQRTRPKWLQGVDSKEDLQRVISQNIKELGDPEWKIQQRALSRLEYLGAEAFDALVQAIESDNFIVRKWAAKLLGWRGEPAVEHLCRALQNDPRPVVRWVAATGLGWIYSPKAVPALIDALKDENPGVRTNALLSLANFAYLRDKRAVGALTEIVESGSDGELRQRAADVLLWIDFDGTKNLLLKVAEKEQDNYLRSILLRKAKSKSPPREYHYHYWPPHLLHVHQLTKDVQTVAGEEFGEREIEQLLEHIDSPSGTVVAYDCIVALGRMRAVSAIPEIIRLLERKPLRIGYFSLARMATPEAVRYIAKAVRSPDLQTKKAAVGGLGESGRWAVPLLIQLLDDADLRTPGHYEEPIDAFSGHWPAEHLAHQSLFQCLAEAGLLGERKNLATGAQFDVDEEIAGLKKWWDRYGQAFLEDKTVPTPKISMVGLVT